MLENLIDTRTVPEYYRRIIWHRFSIYEFASKVFVISAVVKLADRHPKLWLIVFGLSDNKLHVFDKKWCGSGKSVTASSCSKAYW